MFTIISARDEGHLVVDNTFVALVLVFNISSRTNCNSRMGAALIGVICASWEVFLGQDSSVPRINIWTAFLACTEVGIRFITVSLLDRNVNLPR